MIYPSRYLWVSAFSWSLRSAKYCHWKAVILHWARCASAHSSFLLESRTAEISLLCWGGATPLNHYFLKILQSCLVQRWDDSFVPWFRSFGVCWLARWLAVLTCFRFPLSLWRPTWQVQDKADANNVAYTTGKLCFHTDYPVLQHPPGVRGTYRLFHNTKREREILLYREI